MPEVSVFLTSYNHAKYLRRAIDSVLAQTYTDFELVIWDDGSTDDSWAIIKSYTDPRIRAYRNEAPIRGGINFRNAIEQGLLHGNYIAMHHSDDVWLPAKLEKQMEAFRARPELGTVFTQVDVIAEDGSAFNKPWHAYAKIFEQPNRSRHEWLRFFFLNDNALCHPSALTRKHVFEKIGSIRPGLAALADLDLWVRICMHFDIHIVQEKLTQFRVRDNEVNSSAQTDANVIRHKLNQFFIYEHYAAITDFSELLKIFPEASVFDRGEHTNLRYALSMVCLQLMPNTRAILFGYALLFKLLQNTETAAALYKYYSFDYRNFCELSGMVDIFLPPRQGMALVAEINKAHDTYTRKLKKLQKVGKHSCPLCGNFFDDFLPREAAPVERPELKLEFFSGGNVLCPFCESTDHGRIIGEYLSRKGDDYAGKLVLNLSQDLPVEQFVKVNLQAQYISIDAACVTTSVFADASADIVLADDVLAYVADDKAVLAELRRILKPGGAAVLLAPISLALKQTEEQSADIKELCGSSYKRVYARKDFTQMLQDAGFSLVHHGMNWFRAECYEQLGIGRRSVLYVAEKL